MSFSEVFNKLLETSNQSVYALAKNIGANDVTVYKWRDGETMPSLNMAIKLADFFDVTLDELAGRESPPAYRAGRTNRDG